MELPSNRVGLVLIGVVLAVASTIYFARATPKEPYVDLQNVDLLVQRKIPENVGMNEDGTYDWQKGLIGRNPNDRFQTEANMAHFADGSTTSQLSIDLFSEYLHLKKSGAVSSESSNRLAEEVAQKAIQNINLEPGYKASDVLVIESTKESVKEYGTDFASVYMSYIGKLDSLKNLPDSTYIPAISTTYAAFASDLMDMVVPSVAKDVHLQIANRIHQTSVFMEALVDSETDPVKAVVLIGQQQANTDDFPLFTSLTTYFKNNGIIFDDTQTIRFWKYFEN